MSKLLDVFFPSIKPAESLLFGMLLDLSFEIGLFSVGYNVSHNVLGPWTCFSPVRFRLSLLLREGCSPAGGADNGAALNNLGETLRKTLYLQLEL